MKKNWNDWPRLLDCKSSLLAIWFVSATSANSVDLQFVLEKLCRRIVSSCSISITTIVSTVLASDKIDSIKYLTYANYGHRATYCSRAGLHNLFTSRLRATFTGEKLLRAKCNFTKISKELQVCCTKIGAHFGQYFGYLSPKVSEDKKKVFAANRCWFLLVFWVSVPKSKWRPKKKVFAANQIWFRKNQTEEGFDLDLFICQKMLSKPFHEEINRTKRPCGPHKTASWAKCGPRATGLAALY